MYLVAENAFKKHFYYTVHVNDEIRGQIDNFHKWLPI